MHNLHCAVPGVISARTEKSFLRLVPDFRMDGEWPLLISGHILSQHLYILWSGNPFWRTDCWHGCSGNYYVHLHHLGCQHADCADNEPFHLDSTSLCLGQRRNLVPLHNCLWLGVEVPRQLPDSTGGSWTCSLVLGSNSSGDCCLQHALPDPHILPEIVQSTWSPCDPRDQVPEEGRRRPNDVEEGAVEGPAADEDRFHREGRCEDQADQGEVAQEGPIPNHPYCIVGHLSHLTGVSTVVVTLLFFSCKAAVFGFSPSYAVKFFLFFFLFLVLIFWSYWIFFSPFV